MGEVGRKLKEIRKKHNINQTELAEKLNFSRSYIAMLETEKNQIGGFIPSLDFIRILARSFSLSRNELEELRDSDKEKYMKKKEKIPVHLVPVLNSISASRLLKWGDKEYPGDWAEGWVEVDREVTDSHAFALRVEGDNMEPEFKEGEYVVIAPSLQWENGDYVVVSDSKGKKTLRKIAVSKDHVVLISENPKYEPVILNRDEDPRVMGKVIRKIKKY